MKAGMARIRAMMPIRIEAILSMAPMSHGVRGPARAFRFVAVSTRFVLLPWVHATRIILGSFPHRSAGCRHELGRATCKESVCQYVEIPVVPVSLKKKHN